MHTACYGHTHAAPSSFASAKTVEPTFADLSAEEKLCHAKAHALSKNGRCVSAVYAKKLQFICKEGHEFASSYASMRCQDSWCRKCQVVLAGQTRRQANNWTAQIAEIARAKNGRLLSPAVAGSADRVSLQCEKGHTWETGVSSLKTGHWCPFCAKKTVENPHQRLQELAASKGGVCLSETYLGSAVKLRFGCADGHEWEARPNDVNRGTWCPHCVNKTEGLVRLFIETVLDAAFPGKKLSWLVDAEGKQRALDGYNEKLGIAFEYNGEQHYSHVKFFHENSRQGRNLDVQQRRDVFVREACAAQKVKLIEITALDDEYTQDDFISHVSKSIEDTLEIEVDPQKVTLFKTLPFQVSHLKSLQAYVAAKGGKLLSTKYLGSKKHHQWQCKEGHVWDTLPSSVLKGHWCPVCSNCRRVDGLADLAAYAKEKGGKLLSTVYVNTYTKYEFVCKKKHTFKLGASGALHNNQWCAICSGNKIEQPLKQIQEYAISRGGVCTSETYINGKTKLDFICGEGHHFLGAPLQLRHAKSWCTVCNKIRLQNVNKQRSLAAKEKHALAKLNVLSA